jgi:hypothetical protein
MNAQHREHPQPQRVGDEHHGAPVEAVGERAGVKAEQQRRQLHHEHGGRDQARVAGLRGHQQRAGGQRDAVADVGHPRGGDQPPEAGAEPGGDEGLDQAAHWRAH